MSEISAGLDAIHPIVASSGTDWVALVSAGAGAVATLLGAFGGAWLGGKKGYEASLQAGKELTRQSKLEECLSLLYGLERFCEDKVKKVTVELRSGRVVRAQEEWRLIDLDEFSKNEDLVRALLKLHISSLNELAEKLSVSAQFIRDFDNDIDRLHSRSNSENVKSSREWLAENRQSLKTTCSELREAIERVASTEREAKRP
ncbi:hypothetical protein RSO41_13425 [Halomonas sp. I1]|uniref:hypothetical protein n=1 Tax=Halomonas sp. I1 TaxID=393536 RepID=UPI0028DE1D62|nr:hypothetical protein [Halomonas sp. I1]MDT8895652.1 hypothetical protein [Halomonas sp. I1]